MASRGGRGARGPWRAAGGDALPLPRDDIDEHVAARDAGREYVGLGSAHARSGGDESSAEDEPVWNLNAGGDDSSAESVGAASEEDEHGGDAPRASESSDATSSGRRPTTAAAARRAAVAKAPRDSSSGESSEDEPAIGWGTRGFNTFYNADTEGHGAIARVLAEGGRESDDERADADEEAEALKLQAAAAAGMDEGDFGVRQQRAIGDLIGGDVAMGAHGGTGGGADSDNAAALVRALHADMARLGGADIAVERVDRGEAAARLSKAERLRRVTKDAPELTRLLEQVVRGAEEATQRLAPVLRAAAAGRVDAGKGLAYVDVKLQLLLSFAVDVAFYCLLRAEGRPVRDHPVVGEIARILMLLEKMKPVDAALRPQIDSVMRVLSGERATGHRAAAGGRTRENARAGSEGVGARSAARDLRTRHGDRPAGVGSGDQRRKAAPAPLTEASAAASDAQRGAPSAAARAAKGAAAARASAALDTSAAARAAAEEDMFMRLPLPRGDAKAAPHHAAARDTTPWGGLADVEGFGDVEPHAAGAAAAVARKRQHLAAAVNQVEQTAGGAGARAGGDDDAAPRERKRVRMGEAEGADAVAAQFGGGEGDAEMASGGGSAEDEADAYVSATVARSAKEAARVARREAAAHEAAARARLAVVESEVAGERRRAGRDVIKNRGLTKYRKKADK